MKWYNKILGLGALTLGSLTFSPKKAKACSSAIPIGRGGTNVGVADDASAVYWNPAGLVQLEKPELDVTIGQGVYKGFLCYGQPLDEKSALGVNLSFREDTYVSEDKKENAVQWWWLKLGYSRELSDKLSLGANLAIERKYNNGKPITWDYGGKRFQTYLNTDLGILYRANEKFKVGLLLQGYGVSHFTCVRPGASLKLDDKTLLAIEGYDVTNKANSRHLRLGLERKINDKWSVRGGVKIYGKGKVNNGLLEGRLSGIVGASYRKGNLEASVAATTKLIILGLNRKY